MKFNEFSFPHPVLLNQSDYFINPNLAIEFKLQDNNNSFLIIIEYSHNNKGIDKLIEANNAEYFCEITCSATLFREIRTSSSHIVEFHISKSKVRGRVELFLAIIASNDIKNYSNSDFNPEYFENITFDLEKGDVLAYFGKYEFDADIRYEKLKAVSSFMEIIRNNDKNIIYSNFNFSSNKIEIILPSVEYDLFIMHSISKEPKFSPIIHSSIVLSALIAALYNFDNFKDTLWARVIMIRLKNEEQFRNSSIEDKENIPEIAQKLLGNPFKRLISGLHNDFYLSDQIENNS